MKMAQGNRALIFQLAFTFTITSVVLCAAGIVGYDLGERALLLAEDRWADGVIWWEIYFGAGSAIAAVYFAKSADQIAKHDCS